MKAFLMFRDADFDLDRPLPPHEPDLTQDLELATLFAAMAAGDPFLYDVARKAVLSSLTDPAAIVYRQHVLADCIAQPALVRDMYALAMEAIEGERKTLRSMYFRYPEAVLGGAIEVLQLFMGTLRKLRAIADDHAQEFQSEGFTRFFQMLKRELDDAYFARIDEHLQQLRFRRGVLLSAGLGKGGKGTNYVLRRPRPVRRRWRDWIPFMEDSTYTVVIAERDESGFKALAELRGRGINLAANALAQSTDHILSFFTMLRAELGFYIGCLNVRSQLIGKGEPVCFPEPAEAGRARLSCRGLYDVCLSLTVGPRVVGSDVDADDRSLVMITGANQGGKSTFLRSIGLAQLMMQCGMFVGAQAFRSSVCAALFTHYKREEDRTMKSGKLDEELNRMSAIADRLTPQSMVLFNESFAATNEREGAEIAGAIVRALLEGGVRLFYVTHSFELAGGLHRQRAEHSLFLRAERRADGTRTFRLIEGAPQPTSYGEDLYRRIFGSAAGSPIVPPRPTGRVTGASHSG